MTNLFDHAGIELEQQSVSTEDTPLISELVLRKLAQTAAIAAGKNANKAPQLLFGDILLTLKDYFNPESPPTTSPTLRDDIINLMGKYLIIQDSFEVHSHKEVHALASGLYDDVISKLIGLIRSSLVQELYLMTSTSRQAADTIEGVDTSL